MSEKNFTIKHSSDGNTFDTLYPETTISQVQNLQTALNAKQDNLPTVVNNKYLHTNSSTGALEWADADALPPQAGQAGKFLTTDGTTASWGNVIVTNTARVALNLVSGTLSYTVTHGLNTQDVIVQIYDTVTNETIFADVTRTTLNTATIEFGELPESSEGLHDCAALFTAMTTSTAHSAEEEYF